MKNLVLGCAIAAALATFGTLGSAVEAQAEEGCSRIPEGKALSLNEEQGYCHSEIRVGDGGLIENMHGLNFLRIVWATRDNITVEGLQPDVRVTSGGCTIDDQGIRGIYVRGVWNSGRCSFVAVFHPGSAESYTATGTWDSGGVQLSVTGGNFAQAAVPATGGSAAPAAVICQQASINRASSAHTWLRFNLPQANPGQEIRIPGGARNKYVFPTCHRVVWGDHLYRCSNAGAWTLIQGDAHADVLCHGGVPNSPYIQTGEK